MSTGYAIHIGLNYIDSNYYDGKWNGQLNFCVADAQAMHLITTNLNYNSSTVLINETATRENICLELTNLAKNCIQGDMVCITYSGHGGSLPDQNGDEADKLDETWCTYNGHLLDDEIFSCLANFQPGVNVFVISDSCHSGTVTRYSNKNITKPFDEMIKSLGFTAKSMSDQVARISYLKKKDYYNEIIAKAKDLNKEIVANVILLSGCQDNQKAYEGWGQGMLTEQLIKVWAKGRFRGSYVDFHRRILAAMPAYQSPNFFQLGPKENRFKENTPFENQKTE